MARDVKQQQLQPLVTELLGVVNKVVQDGRKPIVEQDGFHRLISYLEELQPLLTQLQNMMINELPPGLRVGLDGIKTELQKFQQQTLHMCKSRSRLYLLIHCRILVENIQETTHTIAQWLSLIPAPARTFHSKELSSKTEELARTMLQAQFLVCPVPSSLDHKFFSALRKFLQLLQLLLPSIGFLSNSCLFFSFFFLDFAGSRG
jgi:hypothetical protein